MGAGRRCTEHGAGRRAGSGLWSGVGRRAGAGSVDRRRSLPQSWSGLRSRWRTERGSATAEYAVVILAAVAFAGILVAVMRSSEVQALLVGIVRGALTP
ncbi:DUF4244 domain-containing protein [Curtobacterium sp. RRHDQ10]|uniref:DUF4244 domain-containing protein n=1 Tax=Curtobacterium phyllosphaerae TaxID=3413379 RepID=UPI003BF065F7